jgi:RHS repeat-associated protein
MTTTKGYDNLNRLTNVMNSAAVNLSSGYGYNLANQRTNQLREDGTYWVYQYDNLGQVTSGKKYWSDGTPVAGQQFQYAFDTIGNRTQTQAGGDASGANLRQANYTNNLLNQITSRDVPGYVEDQGAASSNATVTANGVAAYRKGNYYRGELTVGNGSTPVYLAITNQGALTTNNVYVNNHALVAQTPETLNNDADGNLTNDGKWSYTWDAENRLIGMQSVSTVPAAAKRQMAYAYDDRGRRIYAKIMEWNTNSSSYTLITEERYWYDGWNIIGRADSATVLVQNFVWGLDLSGTMQGAGGVGGLLMLDDSQGSSYFYGYDGNGNVLTLVNVNNGTTAAQYDYGPFGELLRGNGVMAKANQMRFSTKFQDQDSDLIYYGNRYYKSSTGAWLSRDPIGEVGGLNVFGFANNDAIASVDYLGFDILTAEIDAIEKAFPPDGDLNLFIKQIDFGLGLAVSFGGPERIEQEIINRAQFSAPIQTKLLKNYLFKEGHQDPFKMNWKDVVDSEIYFDLETDNGFSRDLAKARSQGGNTIIAKDYHILGGAELTATLGQSHFDVHVDDICVFQQGFWKAEGTFKVSDTYDFNYVNEAANRAVKDYKAKPDLQTRGYEGRTLGAELKTVAMSRVGLMLHAQTFKVTSDPIPFDQTPDTKNPISHNPSAELRIDKIKF